MKTQMLAAALLLGLAATDAAAQPYVYVLDNGRSFMCSAGGCEPASVSLVNTATGTKLAKVTVADELGAAGDIAISADGRELYVTAGSGRLAIIDTASSARVASVALGKGGLGVDVSAQVNRIYVANPDDDTVTVVDVTTRAVVATIAVGDTPKKVVVSPDGLDAYVSNQGSNTLSRISTASNAVTATVSVAAAPAALRVSPDGSRLFVVSGTPTSGTVSIFDTASASLMMTIDLNAPVPIWVDADVIAVSATTAYVSVSGDYGSGLYFVTTASPVAQKLTGNSSRGLAFDAPTSRLFAVSGSLQVWDTTTNTAIRTVQTGQGPTDVVVARATECLFEVSGRVAFTGAGGAGTVTVPAPARCAWQLTPSSSTWPTFLDPLSGTGPATIRFDVPAASTPSRTTLSYGRGQTIAIDQTIPSMFVDFSGSTADLPFTLGGWAVDVNASGARGSGVDVVHVWAWPVSGGAPIFVGEAGVGVPRPDVGAIFGSQYTNAGFNLTVRDLPSGTFTVVVNAHSATTGQFNNAFAVTITVRGIPAGIMIDTPAANARLRPPFRIAGWAIDPAGPTGPGVDVVHVWAYPASGAPIFVGQAAYGQGRYDISSAFGFRFYWSGFELANASLPDGSYQLVVFARSTATGTFSLAAVVALTIDAAYEDVQMIVENPAANAVLSGSVPFTISGWALDRAASSGSGIGGIHAWAYPVGGGAPLFVGAGPVFIGRLDVAAIFGPQFTTVGFGFPAALLPAGVYDLVVYAQTATGRFTPAPVIRMTVQ